MKKEKKKAMFLLKIQALEMPKLFKNLICYQNTSLPYFLTITLENLVSPLYGYFCFS